MATPAQITANRRNALKSTGPRTAAGKAASSQNALRHGLAARAAVVPGEDPADLRRFRAELVAALAPRDGREEVLAEAAAEAAWRLRRVWRAEAALFNRHGKSGLASCLRELRVLDRYEAAANRRFYRAVEMLEQGRTLERVATRRTRRSLSGSANRVALPRTERPIEPSCADLFRTSPVMTSSRSGCSERRRPHIPAPRRAARNQRFCRTNPILRSRADTQPLGAFGTLPVRASRLGFVERHLISSKSVLKGHRAGENPFECASIWPPWRAGRRAQPLHRQQIALS